MRARLLTAALGLFAGQGYEATTIDQIAEQADVARQTVLNHYPHKRDFLRAWGQHRRDQLLSIADQAGPGEPVPEAVLTAILRGQDQGEFNPYADPSLAAEVLTAVYFDTLSRWLTEAEPPFDLSGGLAAKLDWVLPGPAAPPPRKRT